MNGVQARKNAKVFAKKGMGLTDVKQITCQDTDSDGDGYVSCTVLQASGTLHAIECSGAFQVSSGCRLAVGGR